MSRIELTFTSDLVASPEEVWRWMTSVDGISRELAPILRMTAPGEVSDITDVPLEPGRPLFRSWILLFGLLPIDRSDLTLLELEPEKGFLEESPMLSMKLWRHERRLESRPGGTRLVDRLTFEPRFATPLVRWFIRTVFRHRHRVLERELGRRTVGG